MSRTRIPWLPLERDVMGSGPTELVSRKRVVRAARGDQALDALSVPCDAGPDPSLEQLLHAQLVEGLLLAMGASSSPSNQS
jgi:hypothetical protein